MLHSSLKLQNALTLTCGCAQVSLMLTRSCAQVSLLGSRFYMTVAWNIPPYEADVGDMVTLERYAASL